MKMILFCKRTEYPKLGYIIHRLNEAGIACTFNDGNEVHSFHAEHILLVDENRADDAWNLLRERWHKGLGLPLINSRRNA